MKYMLWPEFKTEQLFDLKADPFEENDIVAKPSAKPTLQEMRTRFGELKAAAR